MPTVTQKMPDQAQGVKNKFVSLWIKWPFHYLHELVSHLVVYKEVHQQLRVVSIYKERKNIQHLYYLNIMFNISCAYLFLLQNIYLRARVTFT